MLLMTHMTVLQASSLCSFRRKKTHSGIKHSPYTFCLAKSFVSVGLTTSSLQQEVLNNLDSEEDLLGCDYGSAIHINPTSGPAPSAFNVPAILRFQCFSAFRFHVCLFCQSCGPRRHRHGESDGQMCDSFH